MAIENITSVSDTKEWVLACSEIESCEIEVLKNNISFTESNIDPINQTEIISMYFLENIPRVFTGDGFNKLWIFIDKKDIVKKRPMAIQRTISGYGDLAQDAWGHQKVVNDFSLFHGVWTVDVPDVMWIEFINGNESPKTNATSIDGALNLTSSGGTSFLASKRHPRYQPNRGLLYSSSILLPIKEALAERDFGIFNSQFGAFFRLKLGVLYACRRTTTTSLITTTIEEEIDLSILSGSFDIEKGNIYDIQMQWRGVGNIKFLIGDPDNGLSKIVHTMDLLGKLDGLSIGNPAMPIGFQCRNIIEDAIIKAGCVDLSSEGGFKENRQRGVVVSGEISLSTSETSILVVHIPNNTVNGWINTRDIAMRRIKAYADENTIIRVYYTRDDTAFTGTIWTSDDTQRTSEYSANGSISWNGTGKLVNQGRIPAFGSEELDNPDEVYGDFYLTHGDYFLVTLQAKNNSVGGASMEWGAEV